MSWSLDISEAVRSRSEFFSVAPLVLGQPLLGAATQALEGYFKRQTLMKCDVEWGKEEAEAYKDEENAIATYNDLTLK